MAYESFSIEDIENQFAISIKDVKNLFSDVKTVQVSNNLQVILEDFVPLGSSIGTEKARSEFIIAPILAEVKKLSQNKVSLFSGTRFDVDKDKGLNGFCDFMFSFSSSQLSLSAPVCTIVEAKNDNLHSGFAQCMAEMIAAQMYNAQRNKHIQIIYGCVTTGSVWRFLKLEDNVIYLDNKEYYLDQLEQLLGIFLFATQSVQKT